MQSTDPNVLLTWPLAPHILGHLYNHSLCAPSQYIISFGKLCSIYSFKVARLAQG